MVTRKAAKNDLVQDTQAEHSTTPEQMPARTIRQSQTSRSTRAATDHSADPAADYAFVSAKPGALHGETTMIVQTRQAQKLIYGRRKMEVKQSIIGLIRYGMIVKQIWGSAALDDPYADWFLIQILEEIEQAQKTITKLQQDTERLLSSRSGILIDIAVTETPVRVPISFGSPLGYMGAYLITDFDTVVRALLTARHVGLMPRTQSEQLLNVGAHAIRRAFHLTTGWKYTGLTREEVKQNTQPAQAARGLMGELPLDVLSGMRRCRLSPYILQNQTDEATTDEKSGDPENPDIGLASIESPVAR